MQRHFIALYTHLRHLHLTNRFFYAVGVILLVAVIQYESRFLLAVAVLGLIALVGATLYDAYLLYQDATAITATRRTPKVLSLSDDQRIRVTIRNGSQRAIKATLIDELPVQLQVRDLEIPVSLRPEEEKAITYTIRPLTRGEYGFGALNIFLSSSLLLAERRVVIPAEAVVPVYPSIIQMRDFALRAETTVPAEGAKRMRRLAKSYEFDQIKEYVVGDDIRSINWKATGRHRQLMVNQYEEERAQRIYCIIDKGRTMLMPFNGLSLLDYAINASLALSNVILNRQDRAGLITFSDKIGTVIPADSRPGQLRRLLEGLYRQTERQSESDYDLLYHASRKLLGGRSLIILFTNFESNYALDRVLPGLRRINKFHQLVVVLFENTEIAELLEEPVQTTEDIYLKVTARDFLHQRQLMAARLRQNGIGVVLTRPEGLTGSVIDAYLLAKRRGL